MSLRDRLRMLRPAATGRSAPWTDAVPDTKAGSRAAAEGGAAPLEPAPGLTLLPMATPAGTVLHTERLYPPDHIHGRLPLDGPLHVPGRAWRRLLPVVHGFPMEDAVFVDLETTGLSRGAGTYAFLIGVGRFAEGRFRLRQFFLRDFHEEPAVMAALAAELETARALVTFNGRSFDWPLLETRAAMNRLRLPRLPHLDLLHPARRLWQAALPSCSLSSLEEAVLGLHRADDVPGEEIPQRWFDFLETGDAAPLAAVIVHNRLDILSMAALAGYMGQAAASPLTAAPGGRPLTGAELLAVGRLLTENARSEEDLREGIACLAEALERDLPAPLRRGCYQALARALRRAGRAEEAAAVLKEAARSDGASPWAHIELAKYYEHRARDLAAARDWSLEALEVAMRRRTLGGLRAGQRATSPELRPADDRGAGVPASARPASGPAGSRRPRELDVDGIVYRIRRLERRLGRERASGGR